METVQTEGNRQIRRLLECYNLDMILSIGYRVNSKRAVRFRQWANKVLKDYLVKGYAINQKITQQRYEELKDVVRLMSRTYQLQDAVTTEEADGLLTMMGPSRYSPWMSSRHDWANPDHLEIRESIGFPAELEELTLRGRYHHL